MSARSRRTHLQARRRFKCKTRLRPPPSAATSDLSTLHRLVFYILHRIIRHSCRFRPPPTPFNRPIARSLLVSRHFPMAKRGSDGTSSHGGKRSKIDRPEGATAEALATAHPRAGSHPHQEGRTPQCVRPWWHVLTVMKCPLQVRSTVQPRLVFSCSPSKKVRHTLGIRQVRIY